VLLLPLPPAAVVTWHWMMILWVLSGQFVLLLLLLLLPRGQGRLLLHSPPAP
jgi:hypothetical protein